MNLDEKSGQICPYCREVCKHGFCGKCERVLPVPSEPPMPRREAIEAEALAIAKEDKEQDLERAEAFMRDYVQRIQELQTDRNYWRDSYDAVDAQLISLREECAAKATEIERLETEIAEAREECPTSCGKCLP